MYSLELLIFAISDVRYFPIWASSALSHVVQIIASNGNLSAISLTSNLLSRL